MIGGKENKKGRITNKKLEYTIINQNELDKVYIVIYTNGIGGELQ